MVWALGVDISALHIFRPPSIYHPLLFHDSIWVAWQHLARRTAIGYTGSLTGGYPALFCCLLPSIIHHHFYYLTHSLSMWLLLVWHHPRSNCFSSELLLLCSNHKSPNTITSTLNSKPLTISKLSLGYPAPFDRVVEVVYLTGLWNKFEHRNFSANTWEYRQLHFSPLRGRSRYSARKSAISNAVLPSLARALAQLAIYTCLGPPFRAHVKPRGRSRYAVRKSAISSAVLPSLARALAQLAIYTCLGPPFRACVKP